MTISSLPSLNSSSSSQSLSSPEKFRLRTGESQEDNRQVEQALQATSNTVASKAGVDIHA
jgi:hypothetical protein